MRRYYGKKRYRSKRYNTYGRCNYGGGVQRYDKSKASKALNMAYQIKKLINVEIKSNDTDLNETPVNVGEVVPFNEVPQGDTSETRDGNSLKMMSYTMNISCIIDGDAGNVTQVKMAIVLNRYPQDTAPTWADVYIDQDPRSLIKLENSKRFQILWSKYISLEVDGRTSWVKKLFKKVSYKCKFDGVNQENITNGLYFMYISNEAVNAPNISGKMRIRFVDN